jgi:hypothetical protein
MEKKANQRLSINNNGLTKGTRCGGSDDGGRQSLSMALEGIMTNPLVHHNKEGTFSTLDHVFFSSLLPETTQL